MVCFLGIGGIWFGCGFCVVYLVVGLVLGVGWMFGVGGVSVGLY